MSNQDNSPRLVFGTPEWREAMKDPEFCEAFRQELHQTVKESLRQHREEMRRKEARIRRVARKANRPDDRGKAASA
jgi:hypothetical protein